jgi:hypothetical protein
MRTTYVCPECKLRCYTGTPHMCGPDSLALAWPTPRIAARDQLAPVVLDAIIARKIPGVLWRP